MQPADPGSAREVDALILGAASRAEAALSLVRVPFVLLLFARYVAMGGPWDGGGEALARTAVEVLFTVVPVALSVFLLARVLRRGRLSGPLLALSVVSDSAVGMALLASNSLFPGDAWRGILSGHDLGAGLVLVVASSLRLSVPLVLVSSGIVLAGTAGIWLLDHTVSPAQVRNSPDEAVYWAVLLAAVTAVGALNASRTRGLARSSARRAGRLARAGEVVDALRGVHHDAHSALTALQFTVHRILSMRDLHGTQAEALRDELHDQTSQLAATLRSVREVASGELLIDTPLMACDVAEAVDDARAVVARLHPGLRVSVDGPAGLVVGVRGGRAGLARALVNLMNNAAEGDGERGSSTVHVRFLADKADADGSAGCARLVVEDDGPGLGAVDKPGGHSIGLAVVRAVVIGSGGRVELRDGAQGARVVLELPLEGASPLAFHDAVPPGDSAVGGSDVPG